MDGVDTISATDALAVGHDALGQKGQPLIEQWDGTRWTLPAEPIVPGGELLAIDHVSKDDAWAVGFRNTKTLIEHWDGSHWSVVASPNGSGTSSELRGVVAVSTGDVWAVGATFPNQKPGKPLTEHWNGSTWSVVPTPVGAGVLESAAARGSKDVFAAGISFNARGCLRTLVLHWAGSSWTRMTTPNPFSCDNELLGIDASAAGVEAVGDYPQNCPGKTCRGVTLTARLQNGGWHLQSSPSTTMKFNRLNAVSMVPGTSQAWAVGLATNSFIA